MDERLCIVSGYISIRYDGAMFTAKAVPSNKAAFIHSFGEDKSAY